MPKLQDIEADALHHLQERAELLDRRRREDDNDDLALFIGVPTPKAEDEEVDDMGRARPNEAGPSSSVRKIRRIERESRRARRRARFSKPVEDEGFSTDSTLAEGDAEDYTAAQKDLDRRVSALLDDVKAEDFRDPEKGLAMRFGQWRSR